VQFAPSSVTTILRKQHYLYNTTGKFEGASGTAKLHSTSFTQVFDGNAVPRQSFGFFTGEFEGTITLP
jgi:hypothetical protein